MDGITYEQVNCLSTLKVKITQVGLRHCSDLCQLSVENGCPRQRNRVPQEFLYSLWSYLIVPRLCRLIASSVYLSVDP